MRLHTGLGSSKKVSYTVFMAAKLVMSVKKTPTRTTFFRLDPASSSTAERFLKHWAYSNLVRHSCAITVIYPPIAYRSIRDPPFYHCLSRGIYRHLSRAIDHPIADYGLRIDRERRRSLVGLHCNSCRHAYVVMIDLSR